MIVSSNLFSTMLNNGMKLKLSLVRLKTFLHHFYLIHFKLLLMLIVVHRCSNAIVMLLMNLCIQLCSQESIFMPEVQSSIERAIKVCAFTMVYEHAKFKNIHNSNNSLIHFYRVIRWMERQEFREKSISDRIFHYYYMLHQQHQQHHAKMCMKASGKDKIACGDCGLSYRAFIRTANDTFSRRPSSRYAALFKLYSHVMGLYFNDVTILVSFKMWINFKPELDRQIVLAIRELGKLGDGLKIFFNPFGPKNQPLPFIWTPHAESIHTNFDVF